MLTNGLVLASVLGLAAAQFPPKPEGVTVLKSRFHENVTISFKEPGICETTPGVRSYAGHVHLPPKFLEDPNGEAQDYPINTFFWFIEARNDPENAPLAIWLNGGPGGSSLMGMLEENGPCFVNADSATTRLNPWSWNNHVNMLYIDEPVQVGFSYDEPTNCTIALSHQAEESRGIQITPADFSESGVPQTNSTLRVGTLASQKLGHTTNSTAQAAHALWHFAQTFFFEFPAYKPSDDRISLWAESYGGHYGPGFMRFFQQQNEKIANGTIEVDHAHYMHLDTLGIVNGLIDVVIQSEAYISFPFNNTYGIQAYNQSVYEELMVNFTRPDGCRDQLLTCQSRLRSSPSLFDDDTVSIADICDIDPWCESPATEIYQKSDHGWYDIGHPNEDPFPAPHMHGYLAREEVLAALGSPVNFTRSSEAVSTNFQLSHDIVHGGFLDALAYLLDSGVKVHMMYGDRDYACNWVGGQASSLAVPWSRQDDFAAAGFAPLVTPEGIQGLTRQLGNYSFTRVFQSGHEVPSYQPAAAYEIFMRATFNLDVATGLLPVFDDLATLGPADTWFVKNVPPARPEPECYVLLPERCTEEAWAVVENGTAVIKDYFVVGVEDETVRQPEEKEEEDDDDEWVVVEDGQQQVMGEL